MRWPQGRSYCASAPGQRCINRFTKWSKWYCRTSLLMRVCTRPAVHQPLPKMIKMVLQLLGERCSGWVATAVSQWCCFVSNGNLRICRQQVRRSTSLCSHFPWTMAEPLRESQSLEPLLRNCVIVRRTGGQGKAKQQCVSYNYAWILMLHVCA